MYINRLLVNCTTVVKQNSFHSRKMPTMDVCLIVPLQIGLDETKTSMHPTKRLVYGMKSVIKVESEASQCLASYWV